MFGMRNSPPLYLTIYKLYFHCDSYPAVCSNSKAVEVCMLPGKKTGRNEC